LPQHWPFCWWLALVMDHYSRRVVGFAIFRKAPTSTDVRACLDRAILAAGTAPKYLVSDKGRQFFPSRGYRRWCKCRGIKPRFGAVGKHGSIAVLERGIRTIKESLRLTVVPTRRDAMRRETELLIAWYNEHRPHTTLRGRTPNELYFARFPANRRPRIEPRPNWPRASPCAKPQVLVAGSPGARFDVDLERIARHAHLPVIGLRRAA
jgi:putative transposase